MTEPDSRLQITAALREDLQRIRSLAERIWPMTYQSILSEAQIRYMMELMYGSEALDRQFQEGHQFYLLSWQKQDAGFASLSCLGPEGLWKLHKIYLDSSLQGRGLGRVFLEDLLCRVRGQGGRQLELNVNRNNPALSFYRKLGFEVIREVDVPIGSGFYMNDYLMQRAL